MPFSEHRHIARGQTIASSWLTALQKMLGVNASPNFRVERVPGSPSISVRVPVPGRGVAIAIQGRWRFRDTAVTAAHPAGAAGSYDVFVTASDNSFSESPLPDTDNTDYTFGLVVLATGGLPGTALYEKVATTTWDGAGITAVTPFYGASPVGAPGNFDVVGALTAKGGVAVVMNDDPRIKGGLPVGSMAAYVGTSDPAPDSSGGTWILADGRLVDKTTYAAFFAADGHAHNGGVDPGSNKVRIPDLRGRVPVGADNMGTAQGAASRIPNNPRAVGQNGGEERHLLAAAESGVPVHGHSDTFLFTTAGGGSHSHLFFSQGGSALTGNNTSGVNNLALPGPGSTAQLDGSTGVGASTHDHPMNKSGGVSSASAAAAAAAHNNLQPYEVDNWIVRIA